MSVTFQRKKIMLPTELYKKAGRIIIVLMVILHWKQV